MSTTCTHSSETLEFWF